MNHPYGSWLDLLAYDGQRGIQLPSIKRGEAYAVTVTLQGDYSSETLRAFCDSGPNSDEASAAEFSVSVGDFVEGKTEITLSLTSAQTGGDALPEDADGDGITWLVYEIVRDGTGDTVAGELVPVRESVL